MKKKLVLISLLLLSTVVLAGCVSASDYEKVQIELQDAHDKIAEIETLNVSNKFASEDALIEWVSENSNYSVSYDVIEWTAHALDQQNKAFEDGYIISVEIAPEDLQALPSYDSVYTIFCSAVLENGNYYIWDPEEGIPYLWININVFR